MYDLGKVKNIIYETLDNLGISYVEENMQIDMDSLQFINMIVEFEEKLNITIKDEDLLIEKFSTISNIESTIKRLLEL